MWYVYVIQSNAGRHYTGSTERPDRRLAEHNSGKCATTRGDQWQHILVMPIGEKPVAQMVERWMKDGQTPKKRNALLHMAASQTAEVVASSAVAAAEQWRQRLVIKNRRGGNL